MPLHHNRSKGHWSNISSYDGIRIQARQNWKLHSANSQLFSMNRLPEDNSSLAGLLPFLELYLPEFGVRAACLRGFPACTAKCAADENRGFAASLLESLP